MRPAAFRFSAVVAGSALVTTLLLAAVHDLPVRDPDASKDYLATYLRLPLILLLAFVLDVAPRAALRARRGRGRFAPELRSVVAARWNRAEVRFVLAGLLTWYVAYVSYRNVKSYVPFVNTHLWDARLQDVDRTLLAGHDPYVLLHELLGRDVAAHVLSFVYLSWVVLVPFTLAVALVWSRNRPVGEWYVTAVTLDWVLGALTYLLVPALGPVYADPDAFAGLAETPVAALQDSMMAARREVLLDPHAADQVQMIAAFVSLHVAMCTTICVFVELLRLRRGVRLLAWGYLGLTCLSTTYLGWHYLPDLVGGALLGVVAAWLAARGTGHRFGKMPRDDVGRAQPAPSPVRSVSA